MDFDKVDDLCTWLSSDPESIIDQCGDFLTRNECKALDGEIDDKKRIRLLLEIIGKTEEKCQKFKDILQKDEVQKKFPHLQQLFKTTQGQKMFADNCSAIDRQRLTNTTFKKSFNMNGELPSSSAGRSNQPGQTPPQGAEIIATNNSYIGAQEISGCVFEGDFSISRQKPAGRKRSSNSTSEEETANKRLQLADDSDPKVTAVGGSSKQGGYKMTSVPRGLCVILNNENFTSKDYEKRTGTNQDAESLAVLFSWLGFMVVMCKDKTAAEMRRVLRLFSNQAPLTDLQPYGVREWSKGGGRFNKLKRKLPQHRHANAFVCCILSHGEESGVCGTDGLTLSNDKIRSIFNGSKCGGLAGKPKAFFIQACRGGASQGRVMIDGSGGEAGQVADGKRRSIPQDADFLFAMSTVQGFVSIRDEIQGTWFIQSLCDRLKQGCPRGVDILKSLTQVNKDVGDKEATFDIENKAGKVIGQEIVKQATVIWSILRKDLYFPVPP